jgi:outer membrane receptor protein involved in Fe transport
VTNRNLLAATALQTGALFMAASATSAAAATAQPAPPAPPATTTTPDVQSTNSSNPADIIKANNPQGLSRADVNAITVTGSRIRRPNLESVVPVTSVQGEQFFQRGGTDVGDALNDLPQLRSTFAQQNPGLGIGIAGLNLLDLRGLGPKRTLVLVNGRRHVAADITSSASVPDVNTISTDLIERVDIVTGGNSAVYGSDAVAGVVNFILRRDFDGIQVRVHGSEPAAGAGTTYFASIMAGKNFGGGKGNITLQAEYNHEQRIFGSDLPWLRRQDGFIVSDVDAFTAANAHGTDSFPDRVFVQDIRSATISRFGLVPIQEAGSVFGNGGVSGLAPCGTGLAPTNGAPNTVTNVAGQPNGTPFNCNFLFNPDGSLVAQAGNRLGTGPTGNFVGGNGPTTREDRLLAVFPENKRINLNLLAHYTISDAFEPFVEAKWVRLDTSGNNAGPTFIQGTGTFDYRERTRLDNPFLDPTARTVIANAILASGCNTSLTAACNVVGNGSPTGGTGGVPNGSFARAPFTSSVVSGSGTAFASMTAFCAANPASQQCQGISGPLSAADIARINAGTYRFVDARTLLDVGIRDEAFRRDTWRLVGGVRGTFNTDWSYEISANYGQFNQTTHTTGFLDRQRFMLSLDAGRNPLTGQIQCRAQFDPTSAVQYQTPTGGATGAVAAAQAARLAADIAACVPYNPFGAGNNSAAIQYFSLNEIKKAKMTQFDVLGFLNGDSSQLFELPGGPVGFVLGGEYRRETAFYHEDPFVDLAGGGLTNDVDVGQFNPPAFHVAEAFAEINIPVLKDLPFFHDLTFSGAGRYSRYTAPIKGVWTYNFGGEWAPIRDIRFRGNFGKAVRAPNLSETGFPVVPNFSPTFQDPCSANQISSNPNRTSACTAALGALLPNVRNGAYSLGINSGANPNLLPETSYSLTLGAVVQPRFIPNFSVSVDYYRINVKGVVANVTAQQIVNNCYDLPAGNSFCNLFQRVPAGGAGQNGETPGNILFGVTQAPVNFARRVRRGLDVNANYRARFSSNVLLDTSLIWSHQFQNSNFELVTNPNFENQVLGELGDPKDEGRFDADLKVGHVTFGYSLHYIGRMFIDLAENTQALPSACTVVGNPNTCPPNNPDFASVNYYPAITYHGLRIQWDTGPAFGTLKNIQVYAGVDNVLDRHAPFGLAATGGGIGGNGSAAIYDALGRKFYGGIKVRY